MDSFCGYWMRYASKGASLIRPIDRTTSLSPKVALCFKWTLLQLFVLRRPFCSTVFYRDSTIAMCIVETIIVFYGDPTVGSTVYFRDPAVALCFMGTPP